MFIKFVNFINMSTLIIYTGGTIGMIQDPMTFALIPGDVDVIKKYVDDEGIVNQLEFDIISTKEPIDSSNFNQAYFTELTIIIDENYTKYSNFLVLMGTDTMAYIASLLSYSIEGLTKPIVFTGGQNPLFLKNSDSKNNLKESILGLNSNIFPKEVGIYFNNKWHRAVSATKIDTKRDEAYITPNLKKINVSLEKEKFNIIKKLEGRIIVLKLLPYGDQDILKCILQSKVVDGIILEVFGSGNIPLFNDEIKNIFKEKIKKGLKVVVISQCLKGEIEKGKYQASLDIDHLGFISGGSMTTESASAKLLYLLSKKKNAQQFKEFFELSIRGE